MSRIPANISKAVITIAFLFLFFFIGFPFTVSHPDDHVTKQPVKSVTQHIKKTLWNSYIMTVE